MSIDQPVKASYIQVIFFWVFFAGEVGSAITFHLQAPASLKIDTLTLIRSAGPGEIMCV
jgi:hypothetical protein